MHATLHTDRLVLRPFRADDAVAAVERDRVALDRPDLREAGR